MFRRPTVFVIGAGASAEANFPVGSELVDLISEKLDIRFRDGYNQSNGDKLIYKSVCLMSDKNERDSYLRAGLDISQASGRSLSIDNFLHTHSLNKHIVKMGKIAIANCIIEAERKSLLRLQHEWSDQPDLDRADSTWFNQFFKLLHEEVPLDRIDEIFDNVSIITFNYDRSVEHYLPAALANYFRTPLSEAQRIFSKLKIFHPYGSLGGFPWQDPLQGISFGAELTPSSLIFAASQIRTFTEQIEDQDFLSEMKHVIQEADSIVFLGFSFGYMNMSLLSTERSASKSVYGTTFLESDANRDMIDKDIRASMPGTLIKRIELPSIKCQQLLTDYRRPILRG